MEVNYLASLVYVFWASLAAAKVLTVGQSKLNKTAKVSISTVVILVGYLLSVLTIIVLLFR